MSKPSSHAEVCVVPADQLIRKPADLSWERPQGLEHTARFFARLEQPSRRGVLGHGRPQPLKLDRGARRHGSSSSQQAHQLARRHPGPVPDMGEGAPVKRMCW